WATEVALLSWKNEQPGMSLFPPLTQLFFLRSLPRVLRQQPGPPVVAAVRDQDPRQATLLPSTAAPPPVSPC
ncbi:hypothetical protein MRX96_053855, partial [Rhipicephalus microplus]